MSPRRDWRCTVCKYLVEDIPVDEGVGPCPMCGHKMEKVYTVPTTIFRGSGWTPTFHKQGDK